MAQAGRRRPGRHRGRHDRLTTGLRSLIADVSDTSKLILDPDLDTYYVMDAFLLREPDVIDRLARLGHRVDVLLAAGPVTAANRGEVSRDVGV